MQEYFIVAAKYLITLCMAFYTLESFLGLLYRYEEDKKAVYIRQNLWMFLMQITAFANLALVTKDWNYVYLYGFVQLFLLASLILPCVIYKKCNRLLLNHMCMLMGIGMIILSRLSTSKAFRQYMILIISFVISILLPILFSWIKKWEAFRWIYAGTGILLLSLVLITGELTNGSKLSFTIKGITFQPSEFVKLFFIFFMAASLYADTSLKNIITTSVLAGIHVIILVLSTDLGSGLIFFVGYLTVLFVASRNYLYLLLGLTGGAGASVLAYQLFSHVRVRILAWLDPWSYIDNQGYQITQSLFAIGSGSWFGMGLNEGNPKAIPYVDADFIFSSICEEFGTIFGVLLIIIILSCFLTIMNISIRQTNQFYRLACTGFGIIYIFQVFLTIGGGIKFIPLTGVTLPFISYGGSSIMSTMLMFFIIQSINIENQKETEKKRERRKVEIRIMTVFFSLLFAGMIVYLCYFVATNEQEMINNSYNSRQEILLTKNYRGTILSNDGTVLAETQIDAAGNEKRVYPYNNLFSHIVGYSTNGRMGVEALSNYYLINSDISITEKVSNATAGKKNPGNNVYTTLDLDLQETASKALSTYKGAIIVTEVATGKILALVSKPDFDPNDITAIWDRLVKDTESTVLLNRVTQGLYPPGSTFKMVTALEYIRENPDTWRDYVFQCNGFYKTGNNRINCYHGSVHNNVSFVKSFAKSCNASFANIGMSLDLSSFQETLNDLLFGKELPIDLVHAKSSTAVHTEIDDAQLIQTSIGQGKTLVTPIHLNMITQAIANNGVLMEPYVIDRIESADGKLLRTYNARTYGSLITAEESAALQELMIEVVESGTASRLSSYGYTAGGKTGSAEYNSNKNDSHAWFTGFAPAENPEIAFTVIIEGIGSGGDYAVPMVRRILDTYFEKNN